MRRKEVNDLPIKRHQFAYCQILSRLRKNLTWGKINYQPIKSSNLIVARSGLPYIL